MPLNKNLYNAYQDLARSSLTKVKQVILLYETAIKNIELAVKSIEEGNIELRYNSITKASEIMRGLQLSLDRENGADIAKLLSDFYDGADARLMAMHVGLETDDEKAIKLGRATIEHLTEMKNAWQAVEGESKQDDEETQKMPNGNKAASQNATSAIKPPASSMGDSDILV